MTNPDGSSPSNGPSMGGGGAGLLGAGLGAGALIYDSYQDRKSAKENTDATIRANKEESELAYQRAVQMWHLQNAYNTPEAQMARFKAAGLNPHLIYGQGNPGNAGSPPQYQPANMQHRYEAAHLGPGINAILPTLMAVGTWMQNMRMTEADIDSKRVNTAKAEEVLEYLSQAHPKQLSLLEQRHDLGQYQHEIQFYRGQQAARAVHRMDADFRNMYGDDLFSYYEAKRGDSGSNVPLGGLSRIEFIKRNAEARLKEAQASWADYDITNPQGLMQMVLGGVMQQAGLHLKAPSAGRINPKAKRVKTFYQDGKRRSQVVDFD